MILFEKYKGLVERYKYSAAFKKISLNIGWLFFDKVLRMGVGLIVGVWVARYLGPEQFGKWNYVIALVGIYSAFATLGLDNIVIKRLVHEPAQSGVLLGSSFFLRILGGLLTISVSIFTIALLNGKDYLLLIIAIVTSSSFVFQAFDVIDYYFQSKVESKYTVYAKNSAFVAMSLIKIVLILTHAPLIAFVWVSLFEIITGSIIMIFLYHWSKAQSIRTWKVNKRTVLDLMKESWPLILSGIVIMVYMRIDQIMLEKMEGDRSVGVYSAAVKIAEVWYFIPSVIVSSVYPSLIEAKKRDMGLYFQRFQKLYNLLAVLSISISLFVTFFSGYIINLLYGVAYKEAAFILALTVWAGVFVFLGIASNQFLILEGYTKISFYRTLIGACVNVLLNLFLIPLFKGNGAAIATLIAYGIATFGIIFFRRTKNHAIILLNSFNPLNWVK